MKKISQREIEVLTNISYGFTVKEIAKKLYLSTNTISSHRKNLCSKLEAANSPNLVRKAFQLGYLSLEG